MEVPEEITALFQRDGVSVAEAKKTLCVQGDHCYPRLGRVRFSPTHSVPHIPNDCFDRGDPMSPKRSGGLWPLVTLICVGVGVCGITSNIWYLTEYNEIALEYKGTGE